MKNDSKQIQLTKILLIAYLAILTWVILFKMAMSVEELPRLRNINLIPFGDPAIVNGAIDYSEIILNIVAFIPVGVYISIISGERSFVRKLLPILCLSLGYEVLQFVFRLGASDITDLIGNTAGGAAGILLVMLFMKLFKQNSLLIRVINFLAAICTGLLTTLIVILIAVN